jgi:hypothetical protein
VPWDERERILASVWLWYHATHGDRTYNRHLRRDWTNLGQVSPTAKYVTSRWHQLATATASTSRCVSDSDLTRPPSPNSSTPICR